MKILHIIDDMAMGGGQSLLVEMTPIQKKLGHEVTILQLQDAQDCTLIDKVEAEGVKVEALSKTRAYRSIINVFSIIPYLKNYDVVHVHLFPANYWTALAKFISFSKTPIVTTEHSTDNKRRKIVIFRYIDAFIYKRYAEVIACADKAKETFLSRFPNVNCTSIPNGVNILKYIDAEPYTKRELLGIDETSFVVTMIARFASMKRQDTIVKAISKLSDNFHAVLVGGDGGSMDNVKELAEQLNVTNRVHFLGIRGDVPRILKSSDAIVMASNYEGLSLSSIEGMACGHPFIATNVNGLREVVGGAGILFENEDADELTSILQKLQTDKSYYDEVTAKCLSRAKEYDIYAVVDKYMAEYNKFLSKK